MNPWLGVSLLLIDCLVSAAVGYAAAMWYHRMLAARVAEMEAAVEHYWDRIRKRMTLEREPGYRKPQEQLQLRPETLNPDQIMEIARRNGLTHVRTP